MPLGTNVRPPDRLFFESEEDSIVPKRGCISNAILFDFQFHKTNFRIFWEVFEPSANLEQLKPPFLDILLLKSQFEVFSRIVFEFRYASKSKRKFLETVIDEL